MLCKYVGEQRQIMIIGCRVRLRTSIGRSSTCQSNPMRRRRYSTIPCVKALSFSFTKMMSQTLTYFGTRKNLTHNRGYLNTSIVGTLEWLYKLSPHHASLHKTKSLTHASCTIKSIETTHCKCQSSVN